MDAEELKARTLDSYNAGWRAYMSFNGTLFQQKGTKPVMPFIEVAKYPDQIEEWHAIRAYQDEQRKKGVPITAEEAKDFRNYVLIDKKDTVNNWGIGRVSQEVFLTQTYDNRWVALFTNFRWREGYPKGGDNV